MTNLPPGTTRADIEGDNRLKAYTLEVRIQMDTIARNDDEAIEQALAKYPQAEENVKILDCSPL